MVKRSISLTAIDKKLEQLSGATRDVTAEPASITCWDYSPDGQHALHRFLDTKTGKRFFRCAPPSADKSDAPSITLMFIPQGSYLPSVELGQPLVIHADAAPIQWPGEAQGVMLQRPSGVPVMVAAPEPPAQPERSARPVPFAQLSDAPQGELPLPEPATATGWRGSSQAIMRHSDADTLAAIEAARSNAGKTPNAAPAGNVVQPANTQVETVDKVYADGGSAYRYSNQAVRSHYPDGHPQAGQLIPVSRRAPILMIDGSIPAPPVQPRGKRKESGYGYDGY